MNIAGERRRLSGQIFKGETYENVDLRGGLAFGSTWENCTFERVRFGQADFNNAAFIDCRFVSCDFSQARLSGGFRGCRFARCDFSQAQMQAAFVWDTVFSRCRFQYANLSRAELTNVFLSDCDLHGANLDLAVSSNVDFSGSNFWGAVVPINCAFFAGNVFDSDQVDRLLALLLHARGDWKDRVEAIVPQRARRLVERLVNAASASAVVGETDGDRLADRGRSDAEVGAEAPQVNSGDPSKAGVAGG